MASRRDSYTEETVAALLAAARQGFAKNGFALTSLEEVAAEAGVTTGAIYHHFSSKKGLFQAVAEQIERELLTSALAVAQNDPWTSLRAAFEATLDACAATDVQRIIFLEAPRVIGPEAWREIELKYAYGAMAAGLEGLMAAGTLRPYRVALLAPVLLAIVSEASRAVSEAPETRGQALDLLMRLLECLREAP